MDQLIAVCDPEPRNTDGDVELEGADPFTVRVPRSRDVAEVDSRDDIKEVIEQRGERSGGRKAQLGQVTESIATTGCPVEKGDSVLVLCGARNDASRKTMPLDVARRQVIPPQYSLRDLCGRNADARSLKHSTNPVIRSR